MNTNEPINISTGDMGLVVAFVLLLGGVIKNYTAIKNELIPLITWLLGGLLYQWLAGGWADPRQWMMALISVAGATGLHSGMRNTVELVKAQTTPKLPLLLIPFLLLTGCGLLDKNKFEPGGSYAQTDTTAAMPELYASDASFDLAYKALDLTFKYEHQNRAALWAISPKIKHRLDELRANASQVWLDYAVARQAYLATPTAANLSTLQTVLGKLQQLNSSALTVIASKGEK